MLRPVLSAFIALSILTDVTPAAPKPLDEGWPKELTGDPGSLIVYQPQIERFDGNEFEARAAVAVKLAANDNKPVFGAIWLVATVDTDRDERIVYIREASITDIRMADIGEVGQQQIVDFLEERMQRAELALSLDRLIADLDLDDETFAQEVLKHDPPAILFSRSPAILVLIDGDPIVQEIEGSSLSRVVNTPFLIVKKGKDYYLCGSEELWYAADAPLGPWTNTTKVPSDVRELGQGQSGADAAKDSKSDDAPPKIIVATEPTELIVADGEPKWKPIEAMGLLYMDNTDADVFLEVSTQMYYVLLSGRWYRTGAVDDHRVWEHVPNDELPDTFSDITEDGANGHVLTNVAGTEQARSAALDNTVPQTSAIKRDAAPTAITYDGAPEFVPVEDAETVRYATNTASSVFQVGQQYYLCAEAVWYVGGSPEGPWKVADTIPAALYDIPASNPHHNVTYVYVYDQTPEVVYVGYTPGYVGSYYYHGCVVWGTGWYYQPWYRHHYYPRSWTWGFNVHYNPWSGWSFGLSFSNGPFTFSFGRGGAWFGVGGYSPWRRPYVRGGYHKTNINVNRNINIHTGDINIGGGGRDNLYDRSGNRERNADRPQTRNADNNRKAKGAKNDVFTDRDGNVYRRDDGGKWQQRDGGEWKSAQNLDRPTGSNREATPGTRERPSTGSAPSNNRSAASSATRPQLERDYNSRQQGSNRSQQYNRQRSSPSRGGGSRGGGRRR